MNRKMKLLRDLDQLFINFTVDPGRVLSPTMIAMARDWIEELKQYELMMQKVLDPYLPEEEEDF